MHERLSSTPWLAALALAALTACGGGSQGDPSTSTSSGSKPKPPAATRPAEEVPLGVQPVEGTPVDGLAPHSGHQPLPSAASAPATPPSPAAPPEPKRRWYVSPRGSDGSAGTAQAPFRTIGRGVAAAGPGEWVLVESGTYAEKVVIDARAQAGRPDAQITLRGEGKPKLVSSGEAGPMLHVQRPHWVIDGFDIDAGGERRFAVAFSGQTDGAVLANCEVHHGSGGAGVTTYGGASAVNLQNNHIHGFDRGGIDSHGVVIQPSSRDIAVRNNDIHDNSGDSVQCLGPEGISQEPPARGVTIEGNHFYDNRENAVDIKTCHDVVVRNNRMHGFRVASSAKGDAVVVHYSAKNVLIEGNDVYDAGKGISVGGNHSGPVPSGIVIRKNRLHDLVDQGGSGGTGIRVENCNGLEIYNNTLARIAGWALMLGHGTGGASEGLEVRNNIIAGEQLVSLGGAHARLVMDSNLYSPGRFLDAKTKVEDQTLSLLRAQGLEKTSLQTDPGFVSAETLQPGPVAVDRGAGVELPFCGSAPDLGAVESGC